jgi:hypothetical protein
MNSKERRNSIFLSLCNHSRVTGRSRIYGFFYLIIIVFYLIRPSLPFIEYAIYRDYISKNLCVNKDIPGNTCHGKCYLEKQLGKTQEPVDAERSSRKVVEEKKFEDHLKAGSFSESLFETEIQLPQYYALSESESALALVFVPPKL